MSCLTMMEVLENGEVEPLGELGNSWGGASRIWRSLSKRYLGSEIAWMLDGAKSLWALADDQRLSPVEASCLLLTFDGALLERDALTTAALMLRDFVERHPAGDAVCHLPEIARQLEGLSQKDGCRGAGFWWTSVTEDPWDVCTKRESDEEEAEYRRYNVDKDDKHWWLCARGGVLEKKDCG